MVKVVKLGQRMSKDGSWARGVPSYSTAKAGKVDVMALSCKAPSLCSGHFVCQAVTYGPLTKDRSFTDVAFSLDLLMALHRTEYVSWGLLLVL